MNGCHLTKEENNELEKYAESIIIKAKEENIKLSTYYINDYSNETSDKTEV